MIQIDYNEMRSVFARILVNLGFKPGKAKKCADIFALNTLEGVNSHGVNRFPRFVEYIKKGLVVPDAEPSPEHRQGSIEQWNGNLGPGPLNAVIATEKAMDLAKNNGIGLIAMRNTNHWMRGGAYGWLAARKGFIFIGWTNTEANMPAWGAKDYRLGNNPIVIAVPFKEEAVVLDFAMSQYSYGKLEIYQLEGKKLPYPGGFDKTGVLTSDPGEILITRRTLPAGYWKGSGLSLMLDILSASLSGGLSTHEISKNEFETSLSQVFIAICMDSLKNKGEIPNAIEAIINNLKDSEPAEDVTKIRYPGENIINIRQKNLLNGIPVNEGIWEKILSL